MYQSHWGLQESPFRGCLDPHYFYESPTHEEALARLHFLVDGRRRLGLLMGPTGSGKSLLLEVFGRRLRRDGLPVALVSLQGTEPADMLWQLAAGLQLNPDPSTSVAALWRAVTDRIVEYRYQQQATVILLDDVHEAGRQVLAEVTRLAQFDPSPQSQLTIVLAGGREQMGRLGHHLLDLAELRIDVAPWEPIDTKDFISTSMAQAGCRSRVFDEPAVARLHELSHGIPRRVSRLADLALLAGAGAELNQIDAETIESVYHELGVVG